MTIYVIKYILQLKTKHDERRDFVLCLPRSVDYFWWCRQLPSNMMVTSPLLSVSVQGGWRIWSTGGFSSLSAWRLHFLFIESQQLTGQTVITTLAGPGLAIMMNSNKLNASLANILMMNNQFIVKLDVKEEWSNSQGWWHANYVIIMGSPVYCSHNHLYWLQVNVWVKNKSRQQ